MKNWLLAECGLLVKVDKDAHDVARPHFVLNIGFGHKDFAHFAAIKVGAVVGEANDGEGVVLSEKHYSIRNEELGIRNEELGMRNEE